MRSEKPFITAGMSQNHAKSAHPARNAVEAAKPALQAGENGKSSKTGGAVGVFLRNLSSDTPKRLSEAPV